MSAYMDIDASCEQCGNEFRASVWNAVHAGEDPELKDLLLGGELNMIRCPECGHVAFHENFLIYQEPRLELIAYTYKGTDQGRADELRALMVSGFREAQETLPDEEHVNYEPIILFGLASLAETLRQEEEVMEQSRITELFCREHQIPFLTSRPFIARRRGVPIILPRSGATDDRASILAGLDKLLTINPALTLYAAARDRISAEPDWTLTKSLAPVKP